MYCASEPKIAGPYPEGNYPNAFQYVHEKEYGSFTYPKIVLWYGESGYLKQWENRCSFGSGNCLMKLYDFYGNADEDCFEDVYHWQMKI